MPLAYIICENYQGTEIFKSRGLVCCVVNNKVNHNTYEQNCLSVLYAIIYNNAIGIHYL